MLPSFPCYPTSKKIFAIHDRLKEDHDCFDSSFTTSYEIKSTTKTETKRHLRHHSSISIHQLSIIAMFISQKGLPHILYTVHSFSFFLFDHLIKSQSHHNHSYIHSHTQHNAVQSILLL